VLVTGVNIFKFFNPLGDIGEVIMLTLVDSLFLAHSFDFTDDLILEGEDFISVFSECLVEFVLDFINYTLFSSTYLVLYISST